MSTTKKLTVCIPTFNREDSICKLLNEIVDFDLKGCIDLIVIDDGSKDKSYERLLEFADDESVRILKNEQNFGYVKTFLRCFKECRTEYLIMLADDEVLFKDGLHQLLSLLEELDADFISTQWDQLDSIARQSKSIKEISLLDVFTFSNHAPGLVYKKSLVEIVEPYVLSRLEENCSATYFYPQTICLYIAKLRDLKLYSTPLLLGGYPKDAIPLLSNLTDSKGESYNSIGNLIKRYVCFKQFYEDMISEFSSSRHRKGLEIMLESHRISLYFLIERGLVYFLNNPLETGLKNESYELVEDVRLGALRSSLRPFLAVKNLLDYISIKTKVFLYRLFN